MRISLIILLIIGIATSLVSQTFSVNGEVLAKADQKPLEEVLILVQPLGKVFEVERNGKFRLKLAAGSHRLEIYSFGMTTITKNIELTEDLRLQFLMEPLAGDIDVIEIKALKSTYGITRLKAVEDFGIYESKKNEVIVLDDFAVNKANTNARQVFAKVPGLNIWESDFAGLQLDIAARGLGPSRTANFNTRQNGYDMSADALGYPESYYMPAIQAVDRIEVVRGAASLQYGTQFGGMLNFKLKEAPDKPLEINLEQAIGSFGLLNTFVSAGGRNKKIDYYGYYQYRQGKGWREHSAFDAHSAFGRIGFQANERLKIGLEYSFLKYVAQQPGGLTDELFNIGLLEPSVRQRNWFGVSWNLMAATVDYTFSEQTKLNIRSFGLISGRDALGNLKQIGIIDNPNSNRTLISDQFGNFGSEARLLHTYQLGDTSAALIVGLRYYDGLTKKQQGEASASNDADFRLLTPNDPNEFDYRFPSNNYALFAEHLFYFGSKFSLTTGLRLEHIRTDAEGIWKINRFDFAGNLVSSTPNYDQSSTTRTFPLFGVGASYYLRENLNLYANWSQNFRSITFSDLRVVNPNFQLDSLITDENGYNIDLGIRGTLTPWLSLDASLFLLRYNDRIGQYEFPGSTILFRTNIGNSRHLGIELFAELEAHKLLGWDFEKPKLSLFLNVSTTKATYIESDITAIQGKQVEYVPELMVRAGCNYRWKGIKATFQISHLSDQFADATNSVFNPNALTGLVPAYTVMDFSAEYQLKRLKFGAGINNITDQRYFTRRAESYPGPGIIPATIRSFYASIGFSI